MTRTYTTHRRAARDRQASLSHAGRDIAPIPPISDPDLRAALTTDLRLLLTTAMPETFFRPFCPDHLTLIADIERAALTGARLAHIVYRGFGKTSIAEGGLLWAGLNGHIPFGGIFGPTQIHADANIASIKVELADNPTLLALYPEICHPFAALEGIPQRATGQLYRELPTHIGWKKDRVIFPTIPPDLYAQWLADQGITDPPWANPSGAILLARGILGGIRGIKHKRQDGRTVRLGFALIDDPQTDDSALSPAKVTKRLFIIKAAIGRGGSHSDPLAMLVCGTCIAPQDVMDQLTDHEANPDFESRRVPMLRALPKAIHTHWERYRATRHAFDPELPGDIHRAHRLANKHYLAHRTPMDRGAIVTDPEAYIHPADCTNGTVPEHSAIQHAMNILLDEGPAVFAAECQGTPLDETTNDAESPLVTVPTILALTSGRRRYRIPAAATTLACHIDVHDKALYYLILALDPSFGAAIIDYGTYPDQRRTYFTLRDLKLTLRRKHQGTGTDGAIQAGLTALLADLTARRYRRDDGAELTISIGLIDAGYKPRLVEAACRKQGQPWMPARGVGLKAAQKPMTEYKRKPGETLGFNWLIPNVRGTRDIRHLRYDTNYWKTFTHTRLATAPGEPGSLELFGRDKQRHRRLADALARSEYPIRTEGQGRVVYEWHEKPSRPDNHPFDNLVACYVAASFRGIRLPGQRPPTRRKRRTTTKKARPLFAGA